MRQQVSGNEAISKLVGVEHRGNQKTFYVQLSPEFDQSEKALDIVSEAHKVMKIDYSFRDKGPKRTRTTLCDVV